MSVPDPLLQTLLRDPTAGVLLADARGGILRANETLRAMLAPDVALTPGAPMGGIFAAAARAETEQALRAACAANTPGSLFSRLRAAADDPHHAVSVTALPLAGGDGGLLLLRITDITAQRRLEAQLANSQKLLAIGQLAGGIAHDFNNLLTAILGAAEMMRHRAGLDAQTQADVAQITRAAERAAALVRQLLAFGRQQTLQPRVLSINAALRDIAAMLRPMLGTRISLELALDPSEPMVRVDPDQFDRVLVNLAMNARDAMREGGTLHLRIGHVSLFRPLIRGAETVPPGDYVMVEMRDTGVGIAPEVMGRIFEPFFTTRREQGGTGLGLAMVHGIIRQSDGFLTVESTPGEGTSVRIYLPRATGPADQPPASLLAPRHPVPPGPEQGRAAVLVVDDEPMLRTLLGRALGQRGWRVLSADSAEQALELAASETGESLAAVISDVAMPGMDGPELIQALRARQPGLPAILISGYVVEHQRKALSKEDIFFMPKPYEMRALLDLLARIAGAAGKPVPSA